MASQGEDAGGPEIELVWKSDHDAICCYQSEMEITDWKYKPRKTLHNNSSTSLKEIFNILIPTEVRL
jgi:hypothetical protein